MARTRLKEKSRPLSLLITAAPSPVRPRESGDPERRGLNELQRLGSRFRGNKRSLWSRVRNRSLRCLAMFAAAARDVEEHFFQRLAPIAVEQAGRCVVVLDTALFHDDDALAQPLDLGHVVRGEQYGRAMR